MIDLGVQAVWDLPIAAYQKLRRVNPGETSYVPLRDTFALDPLPWKRCEDLRCMALGLKLACQLEVMKDAIDCLNDLHVGGEERSFSGIAQFYLVIPTG